MSRPAFSWAFAQGCAHNLAPSDRLLLLCLADMVNGENECWPGQPTLKHRTGLALRTIRAALPRLAAAGLIRVEERAGFVTKYHLNRPTNGVDPAPPPRQNVSDHPGNPSPTTPANSYIPPGRMSPGHPGNPSPGPRDILHATPAKCHPEPLEREPSKKERKNPPYSPPRSGVGVCDPPDGFDAFWAVYPRKVGKLVAAKAFAAAVNRGNKPADIIAACAAYPFNANPQYQPHPTTWLREGRWLDEVDDFDPVLRAVGLKPEDFDPTRPRLLQ